MEILSSRLKLLRNNLNVTQKAIAQNIGISERNYIRLENNIVIPTVETLLLLCEYFQCSSDYLLGLSDNPQSNKL